MFETNREMPNFKKIAELSGEDRTKLKKYWTPLMRMYATKLPESTTIGKRQKDYGNCLPQICLKQALLNILTTVALNYYKCHQRTAT